MNTLAKFIGRVESMEPETSWVTLWNGKDRYESEVLTRRLKKNRIKYPGQEFSMIVVRRRCGPVVRFRYLKPKPISLEEWNRIEQECKEMADGFGWTWTRT